MISGLRRAQSPTRAHTNFINKDERFKSIKVCPLIYWTEEEVWSYIRDKDLPYNELHDQNYQVLVAFHVHRPYLILMIHVLVVGPILVRLNADYM